MKDGSVTIF